MSEMLREFLFDAFEKMRFSELIIYFTLAYIAGGVLVSQISNNAQNVAGIMTSFWLCSMFVILYYYNQYQTMEILYEESGSEEQYTVLYATPEEINKNIQYIGSLLDSFKPVTNVRKFNESTLEGQLVQYLQVYYGSERIRYQYPTSEGRVDIVIDGRYGIELKLSSSKKQLETAYYQFYKYSGVLDYLFVVVYDKERRLQDSELSRIKADLANNNRSNISFILTHTR